MIITRTPHRISLVGGGTDFRSWFSKNGGLVVGGTINYYSYVSAKFLPPFHDYKTRVVYSAIESVQDNLDIQQRVVNAVIREYNEPLRNQGLEIFHTADLPGSSGIGSSSSFCVGLINCLSTLNGIHNYPKELAEKAIHIERETLSEAGGYQDEYWASYGGFAAINFYPNEEISFQRLYLPEARLEELENHLLLFYIRGKRLSGEIAASYKMSNKQGWALYRMAEESIGVIRDGNWEKLGDLVDQSWRIKSSLSTAVSTTDIGRYYAKACVYGAWGGKITGAGGGGCLLLVVPPEKQANVIKGITEEGLLHIPFKFSMTGSQVIYSE